MEIQIAYVPVQALFSDNLCLIFKADVTSASTLESEISKLEIQLADKRNQRNLVYTDMWDKVKRVRAGVKANYGDDSQQFEMVGGTRTSERKTRARRTVTE